MKSRNGVMVLLFACFLTGCNTLPKYDSTQDDSVAYLKTVTPFDGFSTNVCVDGKQYKLGKDNETGYMTIPANRRIDISQSLTFDQYNTIYSCAPAISFVAKEGEKYITDTSIVRQQCSVVVVKEDEKSLTGVSFDSSLDKAICQ
jgi:hypothetical protein